MPQQQNKMAPVRGETTVPRHHNEPLITSHKNRDSENHRSEFLAKVRKMAKNEIIFIQSEKNAQKLAILRSVNNSVPRHPKFLRLAFLCT